MMVESRVNILTNRDRAWITVENAGVDYARYVVSGGRKSARELVAVVMAQSTTDLCPIGRRFRLAVDMWMRTAPPGEERNIPHAFTLPTRGHVIDGGTWDDCSVCPLPRTHAIHFAA